MKLDKLTVHVRPISADEAIELGLMMARAWYGRLFGLWVGRLFVVGAVLLVVSIGIYYLQFGASLDTYALGWFFVLMYVFKPVFEVNILLFLSRRLFDDEFDGDLAYPLTPKTIFDLCVRYRLSLQRPVVMAVYLLEGQRGKALSSRVSVLSRGRNNALVRHTVAFFVMEWLLYVTGAVFVWQWLGSNPLLTTSIQGISYVWEDVLFTSWLILVQGIIAVFFVASGFSLYVCRRSLLEGWDIELGFRRLAQRFLEQKSRQEGR